jgi:beta-hydroxylase
MKEEDIIKILESNYQIFKEEFNSINNSLLHAWPETQIYTGEWLTFGLYFKSKQILPNVDLCPKSVNALNIIPGLVNAGFSILKSNSIIKPHTGYTNKVFRYHLGIDIPSCNITECGLSVIKYLDIDAGKFTVDYYNWNNGRAFKFDDTLTHSAFNYTNKDRVILLLDVIK